MSDNNIDSVLIENRQFPPSRGVRRAGHDKAIRFRRIT